MSKPKHTATRTYVCQGRLHRDTDAHHNLLDRRVTAGALCDAALDELASHHAGKTLDGNQAQKLATVVANQLKIQRGPLNNRCRIAVVGNAVNAWNNHVNHDFGLPQKYAGQPVRTIETFANGDRLGKPLVTVNAGGHATLRFPGLPPIRLISCQPLPDDQPTYCSVSVHGKQVKVSLTYRIPQPSLPPDGQWNPYAVLGIDLGVTDLLATSGGISHAGIKQAKLQAGIKTACRIRAAIVRKAIRAKKAGYRPVLDESNHQLKTAKGTPRRYLHWVNGNPTKEYRRASRCVSKLLKQRMRQRRSYRHQVAAQVVKHCLAHGIELIAIEDLKIPNMTKATTGTVSAPNRRSAQKRSLNRRILEQGWPELVGYIKYKARYHVPQDWYCAPVPYLEYVEFQSIAQEYVNYADRLPIDCEALPEWTLACRLGQRLRRELPQTAAMIEMAANEFTERYAWWTGMPHHCGLAIMELRDHRRKQQTLPPPGKRSGRATTP